MSGEKSAEMTAERDGQTGIEPPGDAQTASAVEAPASMPDAAHVNGQGAADGPSDDAPAAAEPVAEEPVAAEPVAEEPAAAEPVAEEPAAAGPVAEAEPVAAEAEPAVAEAEPAADVEPAAEAEAEVAVAEPAADAESAAAEPVASDSDRPAVGPRILGVAADPKPLPTVKATLPTRKRRRRPSAAERHRRAFFAALTELRRGGAAPAAPAAEADVEEVLEDAPVADPVAVEEDVAEQAPIEDAPAVAAEAPTEDAPTVAEDAPVADVAAPAPDRTPSSPVRVTAAMERVGGPEVIKEALKPKQDEKGQPLKWAAVCAQAAEGLKPGDPVFNAWVRLAATPVRDVKGLLPRPPEAERSQRGEGGRRPGAHRPGGRGRRDDRPSRADFASHAQDGKLRTSIRIITGHDEDRERRERDRNRKEQREAKRRAERERLARLGY